MTAQLIAAALALLSALVVAIGTVIRLLVAAEQPLPEEGPVSYTHLRAHET